MENISENEQPKFEAVAEQLYKVYGNESIIPMLYGLATIFKDEIRQTTGSFPLLNIQGVAAAGKTSLSRAISTLFSYDSSNIVHSGFKSSEIKERSNLDIIVVIDDIDLDIRTKGFLKSVYDGTVSMMGSAKLNKIENTKNKVSIIINSQEKISDEIIEARCIFQELKRIPYSIEMDKEFNKMQELLYQYLNYYQEIKTLVPEFTRKFIDQYSKIVLCVENDLILNQRVLQNYKCIMVTFIILESHGLKFPFSVREFIRVFYDSINQANFKLSNS